MTPTKLQPAKVQPAKIQQAEVSPVVDRASLEAEIGVALGKAGSDAAARRAAVVGVLRTALQDGRERARALLESEKNGMACAMRLSDQMDLIITLLHSVALRLVEPAHQPLSSERLAVV